MEILLCQLIRAFALRRQQMIHEMNNELPAWLQVRLLHIQITTHFELGSIQSEKKNL